MSWQVSCRDSGTVIDTDSRPYCEMCGKNLPMKMTLLKLLNFDLVPKSGKLDAHALDIDMRCPACGYSETFGVAISKEEFDSVGNEISRSAKQV